MCTDLRLLKLDQTVSARTLDFAYETGSRIQVVPRGQQWSAVTTKTDAPTLAWENSLGFVALDGFGFDSYFADGLNEAGLSVGTLFLPETDLPHQPPQSAGKPAIDFVNIAGWLLGTCSSVAEVKEALLGVRVWNAPARLLWPAGKPVPDQAKALMDYAITEHLAIHDAHGNDLVVEFLDQRMYLHDNLTGVLTNSPRFEWHTTNLRNYVGLTNVEDQPFNLMGMPVEPTGNGTGLVGLPGDVTPPSRFVRAVVLTQVFHEAKDSSAAVNQAFHSLDLVSVPRGLAASGDYTQWSVARDHDNKILYTRTYDSWTTGVHDLADLGIDRPGPRSTLPMP